MSFQPLIPSQGIAGWNFLQRTYDAQLETFSQTNQEQREHDYFLENATKITTAEDLVSDRRLLNIVLSAFGLQDDLDNRYFIQKVLEDGTTADDALSNRLADDRYRDMSDALGFGSGRSGTLGDLTVVTDLLERSSVQTFELAVGQQDETMRLALNAQRSILELAGETSSIDAKWYSIMGQAPLRAVIETAFALPSSFGQIDLDQQLRILKDKSQSVLGTSDVSDFWKPEIIDQITTNYLAREQIAQIGSTQSGASTALTLLQASQSYG